MSPNRKLTRDKLSHLRDRLKYDQLMSRLILSSREKELLDMRYIHSLSFMEIGDRLGLSESRVIQLHGELLDAIGEFIE